MRFESINEVENLVEENKLRFEDSLSGSSGSQRGANTDASQQFESEDKQQMCQKQLRTLSCEKVREATQEHAHTVNQEIFVLKFL